MRKTKKQRFRASILAILLIASMVFGMVPNSAGQVYAKESTSSSSEEEPGFIDKAINFFQDTGDKIASFFGAGDEAAPAAAFDTEKEADKNTLQEWQGIAKETTENIGRIWTDKTVSTTDMKFEAFSGGDIPIGDSQFLVALSALSSTSNTVTTSSKPLDIVLVLDVSGSMEDPLGTVDVYNEEYNIDTTWRGPDYFAKVNDEYVQIDRIIDRITSWNVFSHWELNGKSVEPKTSANDSAEGHIQFYTKKTQDVSKMDGLKNAVNGFIEATAKENDQIQDKAKQHKISVVKFADDSYNESYGDDLTGDDYNYTQRLNPLTSYTSETVSELTDKVNKLQEAGATSADYGLTMAQTELKVNGREDAQKVVIFFTDGEPNHNNGFSDTVANAAISASQELKKDEKAIVYSVGVFKDADPNNTSTNKSNRFNAYMHGISSNYPEATKWNSLGTRVENSDYYKAASNANDLNKIFEDILQDVNSGSGFPTDIQDGYEPNKGGYVTFDDKLGAYMQVDEFKSIIFTDQKFDLNRNTGVKTEGNVTTYTFEGEGGNSLYPNGNLHDILITVTKSEDLAVGDQVKVQIPASMIPLRHFNVDTDADGKTTMDVTSAWPIRIVYGASIKPGVEETLRDGLDDSAVDQALETYLKNNQADINGKAAAFFYSNLYTGKPWQGHDGQTLGDTVASFDPAKGNIFYYFTENTPIYTDEEFAQPVTGRPVAGDTYYYKKVFWALEEGKPVEKTIAYPFASDNFNQASASWDKNESGEVYIKAGSAKLTRVDAMTLSKVNNTTNTATEIINPQWNNVNNPNTLSVYLGNNGRIAMEVPGALEITKDATVAADKNLNEEEIVKDKEFMFNISIPEMKGKTVKAEKRNLQGDIQGKVFDLSFDNEGNAKAVLKDNEKIYIHGLDAGIEYTVTEDTNSMPAGFALTAIDGEKLTKATGTIVAGSSKKHTFTNTYDVTTISAEAFAPYEKVFDRWDQAPKFQIMLKADDLSCPMPAESTNGQKVVEVTKNNPKGNFGTITYNKPGTYGYTVIELLQPNDQVIGVDYSLASYDVEVKVSDTGKGTLQVDSVVMRQQNTDEGASIAEPAKVDTATFKNTYNLDSASLAAIVSKNYTDTTGASLTSGQFEFKMTPRKDLDEGTNDPTNNRPKLPQGIQPDENGSIFVKNTGNVANFGYATYDTTCVGNTYAYELTEVVPEGVTVESPKLNGMTYDLQRYLVKMKVTSEKIDGKDAVRVTPTYYVINENAGEETYTEYTPGGADPYPVFYNTYDPEDLELPSEGNDAIHGSKTLKGRASLEGETFTFTLAAANEVSQTALENDWIVFEGDENKTNMTATVTDIQNGATENFNFGKVKFTRPGVYQFNVVENAPENGKGMVYDRHTALVTVTVTDNAGKLEGKVTYNNGQDASTSEAAFTNTYTASTTYGEGAALNLSKTLNGRNQAAGEFNFQIAGQDKAADQKLADTDRKFATIAQANDGVASLIFNKMSGVRFTEADAGKTFSYVVKEVLPEDDDTEVEGVQSKGVTYTQTQYRVDIQVNDNGDGTMSTVTTVSRTHDEKGVLLQPEEVLGTYNSKDGKDDISNISFVNSYAAKSVTVNTDTDANVKLTKQLKGRSWKDTDKFDFTLTAKNPTDAPLPIKDGVQTTTAAVTQTEGTAEDTVVEFGFGTITFDKPGEYYYEVSEEHAGQTINGITYDKTPASVWVSVKDPGDGQLTATVSANGTDFVNTYAASLRHNAAGGIVTTKTLHGHDMANRQFTFQVEALAGTGTTAKENAERIDIKDGTVEKYRNDKAATDGTKITMKTEDGNDIEFTADDVGKTFVYRFSEMGADGQFGTGGKKDGYTYDTAVYAKDVVNTEEPTTSVNGKIVGVGDKLTYTIDWVNNAVDDATGAPTEAKVTITDVVPEGTKYVSADTNGSYEEASKTITWNLGKQEAGASGTVSFVVEVLDSAGGTDVTNKAEITVGDNDPKQTNEVTTNVPGKDSVVEEGGELQIGKVLTYTISYMNPEEEAATVTIKDIIPDGLDYVDDSASNGATYNEEDRTLKWTIADVQPGTEGTVTFDAKVNESAETVIDNKATIQIGDNAPTYDTNTDQNEIPKDGNLAISKTIALAEGQGTEINKEQTFTFTVELKDAKGAALTKEYAYTVTGENGEEIKKDNATNGTEISFQHGQKAVITGLPAGAQYTVTETKVAGYTTSVNGQVSNVASGTITADATAAVDFTNTYSVAGSLSGSDALTVTKVLEGREWLESDRFAYTLTAADKTTKKAVEGGFIKLPGNAGNLEITKESAEHKATFGDIQFTIAGTFKFNVTEQPSGIAGITDDKNAERTVVVKVTDKKDGTLEAIVDEKSENLTFTNTYGAGTGEEDIAAKIPATKKLTGRDMKADEFQFEVVTRKADEAAKGFKEEVVATGTNAAAQADTAGTVTFAGKDDVKLAYTVESLNKAVEDGYAVKEIKNGQSVWTVSYTARELTDNLPGGVTAVEGKTSYDFTIVVRDNNDGTLTAAVQAPEGGIAFENAYTTGGTEVDTDPTDAAAYFNKKLVGRDWLDTDEFTFTITPQNGAPAPENTTTTVKKAAAKDGDLVPFGFGKITFTDADMAGATANEDGTLSKTFKYQITENDIDAKKMPGVTKDNHVAILTITVTDNQQGELSASASMTAENGTFTNTYKSSLDYTVLSGLQITKVLKGRDMEAGQFTFTVTPEDKASADKLGLTEGATEFTNTAKPAGETDTMDVLAGKNVTFTQEDAGKTFTYTVAEKAGDNKAYTYDDTPRTVTIEVKDNKNATLTVITTVKKDSKVVDTQSVTTGGEGQKKATVVFENTYNADPTTLGGEGNVKINAKKSLTNRPMVAGEFTFNVEDNEETVVTTGKNGSDGNITFKPIQYTTDKLIEDAKAGIATKTIKDAAYVYTYEYKVVEAESNFGDGVTPIKQAFTIKVVVTDDGNGKLSINVVYPDGTNNVLPFENAYGAEGSAVLNINGHKALEVESGDNIPNITGKYTFTIEGSEGAPMPEKTEAKNDAVGNVDFGTIQYTMENVFGSEPAPLAVDNTETDETGVETTAESDEVMPVKSEERTKEFTYTVKESGNVAGVDNDKKSEKTFKVTVTDNGDGTIKVDGPKEFAFEFTNTYSVDPVDYSINTDLTINKELDGRELREGEFTFELVSEDGKVVSTATNSADGSVAFKAIAYKTPGTYNYVIREQKGSAGGVEYDSAEHTVVVVVTDNGDGTMTAKAELKSRDGEDAKNAIVFKNSYTAQPASVTLGASKAYTGGKLGDGQFTFELRDESDKLISKAKNNENGQIVFETIEYKNVGTYKYKISEVNDEQKHVTYDKTVYGVTVTVTDNGEGSLMATVEYDGGKAPVFTNKYSKPAKPAKPEEPKGPTAVKTGDEAPVIPFIILMVATLAIIVTITFIFFRRKRR